MTPPRRRLGRARAALFVLLAAAAALALRVALWRPAAVQGAAIADGYTRAIGVVHVHTTLSDGGGTPEEVVAAARAAGLGFVFVTDHNELPAKPLEGYHGGVLLGVGTEISTTGGHLLALGLDDPQFRFGGEPDQALDDVRLLGGAPFAAHPVSPRADFNWTSWDLPGPWGLEIYNGDSQWRAAGWPKLARTAALYGLNPRYALLGSLSAPRDVLAHWDALLARRDTPALVGADAHSRVPLGRRRSLRFPSYEALFALARNHVLLERPLVGQAAPDLAAVVDALRRGRSYLAIDALAPADDFAFVAETPARRWTMGDTLPPLPGLRLRAWGRVPAGAELQLLRDGRTIARGAALDLEAPGPGVYRVEARVPGWELPWILSNAIYVFEDAPAASRRAAADWPAAAEPAAARQLIEDFEHGSAFGPERDPASTLAPEVRRAGAGMQGSAAGVLEFRLSRPEDGGPPHGWCALVSRQARSFAGFTGLVLALRADGEYRLWLQLRDVNPRGSDGGNETWLTSLRTSREWRRVAVPFARLRSLDPNSDGRLDLDRLTSVGFVLDDLTVKPGTRGRIEIDDVGLY